jgi:uncharacterized OB-fold protein
MADGRVPDDSRGGQVGGWPAPDLADPELAPFWAGASVGRLLVQRCDSCGTLRWPPRAACAACGGSRLGWAEVSGAGSVYSWTEVHRSPLPYFRLHVPYAVALVELREDPRLRMLGLLEPGPQAGGDAPVSIGMDVRVRFRDVAPGVRLPTWISSTVKSQG